jgi:MoxR-like ATPase
MAWGDPGLGKSDIAEAVVADLRWDLMYANLATRDPAELAGMPWVREGKTIRCRPDWLPETGSGMLFLDELPQAGIANRNIAAATLIREHRIGEHRLPATWMVVCAG